MAKINTIATESIREQCIKYYGFKAEKFENLTTLVNDIFAITTPSEKFALKLYHFPYRTIKEVQWEIDLLIHLLKNGAPVSKPILGQNGYLNIFEVNGQNRVGVLFEWADGDKPQPSISTYTLLGKAAAQIHHAADTFASPLGREGYDINLLIDEQLQLMKKPLKDSGQFDRVSQLSERLKKYVERQNLDQGICHMDLTLDNIHRQDDVLTIFDFDSAGKSWRAIEPYGVLLRSRESLNAWLDGYRSIRTFNKANEDAVSAFAIIGEIRNITWELGLANSSRGKPLLTTEELPDVVDSWFKWEEENIVY